MMTDKTKQKKIIPARQVHELKSLIEQPGALLPHLSSKEHQDLKLSLIDLASHIGKLDPVLALRYSVVFKLPLPKTSLEPKTLAEGLALEDLIKFHSKLVPTIKILVPMPYIEGLYTSINSLKRPLNSGIANAILKRIKILSKAIDHWGQCNSSEELSIRLNKCAESVLLKLKLERPRDYKLGENSAKDLLKLGFSNIQLPSTYNKTLSGLSLIASISSKFGSMFLAQQIDTLAENTSWQRVTEGLQERITVSAQSGQPQELQELIRLIRKLSPFQNVLTTTLNDLWNRNAAQLATSVQDTVRTELGVVKPDSVSKVQMVDDSESVAVTMMASALLKGWDARNEGPNAAIAFSSLKETLSRLYNLRLGGEVGASAVFNPNLHEWADENRSPNPKLVRPWVEWSDGNDWKVLVKAVVNP